MKRSLSTENVDGDLPPTTPTDDSGDESGDGNDQYNKNNDHGGRKCKRNESIKVNAPLTAPLIPYGLFVSALIPIPEEQKLASDRARYWMSELQVTLPHASVENTPHTPCVDVSIHPKYAGMLSPSGESLLAKILQRVSAGDFDITLTHYCMTGCHSGPYIPDSTSPFYSRKHFVCLNSFENICICGITEDETPIKTGYIVFHDNNWSWSRKGVLYRIVSKHYSDYFTKYFDQ